MSLKQIEDFSGNIADMSKLANEKNLSTDKMISIISDGDNGIKKYFNERKKPIIEEHKSMLDDFQL